MVSPIDMNIIWEGNATGYNVLWGHKPDKLYHCCQVFSNSVTIGGLVKGQNLYIRVDSFNDSGITEGDEFEVP